MPNVFPPFFFHIKDPKSMTVPPFKFGVSENADIPFNRFPASTREWNLFSTSLLQASCNWDIDQPTTSVDRILEIFLYPFF